MNNIWNLQIGFAKGVFCAAFLWVLFSPSVRAADGTPAWTNYLNNGGDASAAVALDNNSNVFITSGGWVVKYSNAGVPIWTNMVNFNGGEFAVGQPVAVDSGGNAIVTGLSGRSGIFAYLTLKYSAAGVLLWSNSYNSVGINGNATPSAVVIDSSGNIFVTGHSTGSGGNFDYATIKYSQGGVPLWTNTFNGAGNGNDYPLSSTTDSNNNLFVTGYTAGNGSGNDWATIKYSSAGVPLWTNIFNGAGNGADVARQLTVDINGNVVVVGSTTGNGSGADWATIKYSNAGIALWTNIFNGTGNGSDSAKAVAADKNGNVYVFGTMTGNGSGLDFATIKYSSAGVPLWTNIFNGSGNGDDVAYTMALDKNANVCVAGYSTFIGGAYGYATIKYSNQGVPAWTNFSNLGTSSEVNDLVVDGGGNVFVTGYFFINGILGYTCATIKYSGPPSINFSFITTNGNFGFANNQFSLSLAGPAGSNAVISASTDLQNWVPLVTNPLTSATVTFTDILATNYVRRFYRAALQ